MGLKIEIKIDTRIYPLEAIYAASCVFIDRAYIFLAKYKDKIVTIEFSPKEGMNNRKLESIKGEFMNELLNYLYRIGIAKNNKKVREHIVYRALFSSIGNSLLEDDEENTEDPLGITNPWNE